MNKARSKYHLHALVLGTGSSAAQFDDAEAGFPLERRLNRIERVATAYRGKVDNRFSNGLLMSFETADAALLGACEMQLRCAVLPQVSRHRLALRIGIHQGMLRQRVVDETDNTQEIAAQLAVTDNAILASDEVVNSLNTELRALSRPLANSPAEISAYKIDWRSEIPAAAYGGESFWPTTVSDLPIGPSVVLHYGLKTLALNLDTTTITVGRNPRNDLVLSDINVSRNHCRIERRNDCIVLIDSSTNGTCVKQDECTEALVKNNSAVLKGKGLLFFGRPFNGERRGGLRYEAN